VSLREKLRDKLLRSITALGMHFERSGVYEKAVVAYQRGIHMDDLAESYYQGLMNCHIRLGRHAEALSVYTRCKKILAAYGIEPSPETESLRNSLRTIK
jgi:DNA-binding SARP family transcriptional activator